MKKLSSTHYSSRFLMGFALISLVGGQALLVGCGEDSALAEERAAAKVAAEKRIAANDRTPQAISTTLAAGTEFLGTLQAAIATDKNHVGDRVSLRIEEPVSVSGRTIVPVGAAINGVVTHIDPAGSVAGGAEITLRFEELVVAGKTYPIACDPFRLWITGDAQESVLEIGGGAIAGSVIGGILGGQKGAIQGAVIGGAVGTGVAVITPGEQIVLQQGLLMKATLVSPVVIQN
jgi:hypothetical protein